MDPHTKIKFPCPFCERETLEVLTWPAHSEERTSRSAVAKSRTIRKVPEGFELVSERCVNCGKDAREIKEAWNGSRKPDEAKRRKRLEELRRMGFSGIVRG